LWLKAILGTKTAKNQNNHAKSLTVVVNNLILFALLKNASTYKIIKIVDANFVTDPSAILREVYNNNYSN
jgi:hypothetical protein